MNTSDWRPAMLRNGVIAFLLLLLVTIIGVNAYLSPDDLRSCSTTPSGTSPCQKVDAIIAISGGQTSVRTAEAIRLYKNSWARYVIFSGAAADSASPSNAAAMRRQALAAGIPENAIIIEEFSRTTRQNARNIKAQAQNYAISKVIVTTSPYHQRRAGLEFTSQLQGITVLNHPAANDPDWPSYWWLTPRGWWLAAGEVAKIGAVKAGESQ